MNTCQKCGAQLQKGLPFCGNCGTQQNSPPPAPPPPHTPPPYQSNQPQPMQPMQPMHTPPPYQPTHQNVQNPPPYMNYNQPPTQPIKVDNSLLVLSIICVLFFWLLSIYGFSCLEKAKKAQTQAEADAIVSKGKIACIIGIIIGAILTALYIAAEILGAIY